MIHLNYAEKLELTVNIILLSLLLIFATNITHLAINQYRPMSYWVEYESIEPTTPVLGLNEQIIWRTSATRHRPVDMYWNDTLVCQYEGMDEPVMIAPSVSDARLGAQPAYIGNTRFDPSREVEYNYLSGLWEWGGALPKRPGVCQLRSQITVRPGWGTSKTAVMMSDPVIIRDRGPITGS